MPYAPLVQEAVGATVLEGAVITVLVLTGVREAVMNAVPLALKQAIGVGIGAGFLSYAFIKVVTGNGRAVRWPMWIVCLGFVVYFARPWIKSAFGV